LKYLLAVPVLLIIVISLNKEIIAQSETFDLNGLNHFRLQTEFHNPYDSLNVPVNILFPTLKKSNSETGYLLVEETTSKWDSTNWNLDKQKTYHYDVKNNLIELVNYYWEDINWTNGGKYKYSYDSSLNLTESLFWWWRNSNWENRARESFSYDENQNNIEYKWLLFDSLEWHNEYRRILVYDENNYLIQTDSYTGNEREWMLIGSHRYNYKYNLHNNLSEYRVEELDLNNWTWTNIRKDIYTYDENNLLTELEWFYWWDLEWQRTSKRIYSYERNNLVEYLDRDWIESDWINFQKGIMTYNESNRMVDSTTQRWNLTYWRNSKKKSNTYDVNHNLLEEIKQTWDDSIWVNLFRIEYEYIPAHKSSGKLDGYELSNNYPNPFNSTTNIQFKLPNEDFVTLKIYDAIGSEIVTLINKEMQISYYNIAFNATGLASGVYFYRLQAGDFSETRKMVYLK